MTSSKILEKYTCEIVADLLPFYAQHKNLPSVSSPEHHEKLSSIQDNDTQLPAFALVKKHVKCCDHCRNLLEMIQEDFKEPTSVPPDTPPIHFRRKYYIRLALGVACSILTAAGIVALLF